MRFLSRPNWLLWVFGILLLVVTVAGAGWMFNRPDGDNPSKSEGVTVPFGGHGIVAQGYVDVKPGISRLYPLQPGRVVWVIDEGKTVDKGQELLKLDDTLAKTQLADAKIALKAAEKAVEEAKLLHEQRPFQVKQQEALLRAAQFQKKMADQDYAKMQDLIKAVGSKFDLNKAREAAQAAQAQIDAAQQKLDELNKVQPKAITFKVALAELDRDHKAELVKQAEKGLKETTVVAPDKGTILRVLCAVGDPLGSSPKAPAIEFCPTLEKIIRAEVPQEWANRLKPNQEAVIEDDVTTSPQWQGKVIRISGWFTHRRSIIQEPFQFNDVRTLECLVAITQSPPNAPPLRIGQRMRVMIRQGGP